MVFQQQITITKVINRSIESKKRMSAQYWQQAINLSDFKKLEVVKKYPNYTEAWNNFEQELHNESKYTLIKSFVLSKPNLIPLSDVYIYKKL